MEKQTIGKVQLWIGIILLIVGIVGVIGSLSGVSTPFEDDALDSAIDELIQEEYGAYEDTPTEIKLMIMYNLNQENLNWKLDTRTSKRVLASTSLILIVLSILFITQGLANKSER
jgi:hypothetical protein